MFIVKSRPRHKMSKTQNLYDSYLQIKYRKFFLSLDMYSELYFSYLQM